MLILWSFAIVAGLLLLVHVMIAGVPHVQSEHGAPAGTPRAGRPMLGAFLAAAGVAGYVTMGSVRLQPPVRAIAIVVAGIVMAFVTRWVVIKAFTEPPPDPEDDPRYRYQGHVGRLSAAISDDRPGRVIFEADGKRFDLAARSIDAQPIPEGVEVVIERIDDAVATVEPWSTVEQRL